MTPTALMSGPGVQEWPIWTTTARLVVSEPDAVEAARSIVDSVLAEVDEAANRFRPDAQVRRLAASGKRGAHIIGPVLTELVGIALHAAALTDGDVDPTLGAELARLGYDRDLGAIDAATPRSVPVAVRRRVDWRDIELDGSLLLLPRGMLLDLGATAKAWAADRCAETVATRLGCGVLVSLGGDLRVAGPAPHPGWEVVVQDGPGQPACTVGLRGVPAVATSSTLHRSWQVDGRRLHHILDPATCRPAPVVWRTVSVAAQTCVAANTVSTAAMVRGHRALSLVDFFGVAARFVAADGSVLRRGGWPA